MKCDLCGHELGSDQTLETFQPGRWASSKAYAVVPMLICRACAERRQGTRRLFGWVLLALVLGSFAIAVYFAL